MKHGRRRMYQTWINNRAGHWINSSISGKIRFFNACRFVVLNFSASHMFVFEGWLGKGRCKCRNFQNNIIGRRGYGGGAVPENNFLLTLSLRHQSGCRRYKAFQCWHKCALSARSTEWKQNSGQKKGWGGGGGMLKNLFSWLWWWRGSEAAENRQKFLKLQSKAFCGAGLQPLSPWFLPSFAFLVPSNMSLLIARPCSALAGLSTLLRSIQRRGGGCRGKG